MSRKIIMGIKNERGEYVRMEQEVPEQEAEPTDISIDDLMKVGLQAIRKAIKSTLDEINLGSPSRETIGNLKDLMSMLRDLKKEERDLLDNMTDEQLEQFLKSRK